MIVERGGDEIMQCLTSERNADKVGADRPDADDFHFPLPDFMTNPLNASFLQMMQTIFHCLNLFG
ncbi:hypothetical protein [Noviherbaspirillum malthae]|uniref:hypothetical protein n=1 Tax=Noviherbaspirillum malthae TaxID=1260987 RepID=UPI002B27AA63|nr:hypothetical protein [Noviherbaspirillum malthae]